MSPTDLQALVVSSSLLAVLVALAGVVGLLRWRRRNAGVVEHRTPALAAVSRTLRRGGTVADGDRELGVLAAENLTLSSLPPVGTLLLCGGQTVRAVARPDDSAAVVLVLSLGAAALSLAALSMCGRALVTARRQGIRPERLW